MTDVVLEMRIRVPVTLETVNERKQELRKRVADLDPRPSFFSVERWLLESLDKPVEPMGGATSATDWLPRGKPSRRRGRGPGT